MYSKFKVVIVKEGTKERKYDAMQQKRNDDK